MTRSWFRLKSFISSIFNFVCLSFWVFSIAIQKTGLNDVNLLEGLVLEDALEAEALQVDGVVGVVRDELLDSLADGAGVLQAVSARAVGEDHVLEDGVAANDEVLVERVELVGAGPGAHHLQVGERGHAVHQRWLDAPLEVVVVDVAQVQVARLVLRPIVQATQVRVGLLRPTEPDACPYRYAQ